MIHVRLLHWLRFILICSFILLLLLPPLPYSPLSSVSPVSADGDGWYLDGQPVITRDKDQDNPPCYINRKVTVSDGAGAGTVTNSTACFKESSVYNAQIKWSSPPEYLRPGSTVDFSMTAGSNGGTISQASGVIKINNGTLLEVHDLRQPSNKAAYAIPSGSAGAKLEIYVSFMACGLHGYVTYNYVYKGMGTSTAPATQPTQPAQATTDKGAPGPLTDKLPVPEKPLAFIERISGGPIYVSADSPDLPPSQRKWVKIPPGEKMYTKLAEGWTVRTPEGAETVIKYKNTEIMVCTDRSWYDVHWPKLAGADTDKIYSNLWEGIARYYRNPNKKGEEKFEVETDLALTSIKGTDFVIGTTGQVDTVKVIEGTVEVKYKSSGAVNTLSPGQQIIITRAGPGPVSTFDVAAEKSKWGNFNNEIAGLSQSLQTGSQSSSSTSGQSGDTKKKIKIGPLSCFIATAAYGSETAQELDTLRSFRDKVLMQSEPGRWFVDTYYQVSPPLAEYIAEHEDVRTFVREALLDPAVLVLKSSQEIWNH